MDIHLNILGYQWLSMHGLAMESRSRDAIGELSQVPRASLRSRGDHRWKAGEKGDHWNSFEGAKHIVKSVLRGTGTTEVRLLVCWPSRVPSINRTSYDKS